MNESMAPAPDSFVKALIGRLRIRRVGQRTIFVLDLRGERWGHRGWVTVRNPRAVGWPDKGVTTSDRATAEKWIENRYCSYFRLAYAGSIAEAGIFRVEDAAARYISDLENDPALGPDHGTTVTRRSYCQQHIIPKIGQLSFPALDRPTVGMFLMKLQVTKSKRGVKTAAPAARRTKAGVRATLLAMWHHFYPFEECPFMGIRLPSDDDKLQRRMAAQEGDLDALIRRASFGPEEMRDILAAGFRYDAEFIIGRPNVRVRVLPNTPEAIACQVATGARISELMLVRWKHVFFDEGLIFLPGTKSGSAPRWVPLQRSLVPWLERLRAQQGNPGPNDFVIQTHPRRKSMGSKRTYQKRFTKTLILAGLKQPGKATHVFRATFASWANSAKVEREFLKFYLGHATVFGGATDDYVELMKQAIPAEHRTFMDSLPSPEEVQRYRET
jgi:integrase